MEKIYESPLQEIYHDSENSILKNVWKKEDMEFEMTKNEMEKWMEFFNKHNPTRLLTDNQIGQVLIPEIQAWVGGFLFPDIVEKGVMKWAIVSSDEIFSRVSVEQMFDEVENTEKDEFQQLFFKADDEEKALNWLKE